MNFVTGIYKEKTNNCILVLYHNFGLVQNIVILFHGIATKWSSVWIDISKNMLNGPIYVKFVTLSKHWLISSIIWDDMYLNWPFSGCPILFNVNWWMKNSLKGPLGEFCNINKESAIR